MKTIIHILVVLLSSSVVLRLQAAESLIISSNDVIAFVGGGDVSAAQFSGHLESILVRSSPRAKFRNFGWEGDTVFAQPRDFNFPPLTNHLRKVGATVIFVQFGRMEAFAHANELKQFATAYDSMLTNLLAITPRIVLVTPIPFENLGAPLPDVSTRNAELAKLSDQIQTIARARKLPLIDLFRALQFHPERLTSDGIQLTPRGHALIAQSFAKQLGLPAPSLSQSNAWTDPHLEKLRQLIIAKNRLWFDYWRPQNWAFLAGDRTEQPSSRDHRDPKIRWFPQEMEEFTTLIGEKEKQITSLAEEEQ